VATKDAEFVGKKELGWLQRLTVVMLKQYQTGTAGQLSNRVKEGTNRSLLCQWEADACGSCSSVSQTEVISKTQQVYVDAMCVQ
jgi:hypothetical protein